jgi:hypothetical protein
MHDCHNGHDACRPQAAYRVIFAARIRGTREPGPIFSGSVTLPPRAIANFDEAPPLNDSLSIVVPVCNAERGLARQLGNLLDVLPDLTSRFEIIVVDDGSTDHTVELARDYARRYPQLRVIRHVQPRGSAAAVATGLAWAQGETVFVQEEAADLSSTDLRRLWSLRHDREVVMARAGRQPGLFDPSLIERLTTWGQALRNRARGHSAGSIHMIRRKSAETLPTSELDHADLTIQEQEAGTVTMLPSGRTDEPHAAPARKRRPALLEHLRQLPAAD